MGKSVSKLGLEWPSYGRQSKMGLMGGGVTLQNMKTLRGWTIMTIETTGTEDRLSASLFWEEMGRKGWG